MKKFLSLALGAALLATAAPALFAADSASVAKVHLWAASSSWSSGMSSSAMMHFKTATELSEELRTSRSSSSSDGPRRLPRRVQQLLNNLGNDKLHSGMAPKGDKGKNDMSEKNAMRMRMKGMMHASSSAN
jgi:hypothetical protein